MASLITSAQNTVQMSWPIANGFMELKITADQPLPAQAWTELAVLMSVASGVANRIQAFNGAAALKAQEHTEWGRGPGESEDDTTANIEVVK